MDELEARRILGNLRLELAEADAEARKAEERVTKVRALIEQWLEVFPGLAAETLNGQTVPLSQIPVDEHRPRGQNAVRIVMQESPGQWFTIRLMTRELEQRGWRPDSDQPENAVRTALTRLADTDPHVRKGMGARTRQVTFAWFDKPETPTASESSTTDSPSLAVNGQSSDSEVR
jgi:hypothetical protein